jgi:hypothetical protein
MCLEDHGDPIFTLEELLRLHVHLLERLEQVLEELLDRHFASNDAGVDGTIGRLELDVGIGGIQQRIDLPAIESLVAGAEGLDLGLGHV